MATLRPARLPYSSFDPCAASRKAQKSLILFRREDLAFSSKLIEKIENRLQELGVHFYSSEEVRRRVEKFSDCSTWLKETAEKVQLKVPYLILGFHGSYRSLGDLDSYQGTLPDVRSVLDEQGTLFLLSCSTAKRLTVFDLERGYYETTCVAEKISLEQRRRVVASKAVLFLKDVQWEEKGQDLDMSLPGREQSKSCEVYYFDLSARNIGNLIFQKALCPEILQKILNQKESSHLVEEDVWGAFRRAQENHCFVSIYLLLRFALKQNFSVKFFEDIAKDLKKYRPPFAALSNFTYYLIGAKEKGKSFIEGLVKACEEKQKFLCFGEKYSLFSPSGMVASSEQFALQLRKLQEKGESEEEELLRFLTSSVQTLEAETRDRLVKDRSFNVFSSLVRSIMKQISNFLENTDHGSKELSFLYEAIGSLMLCWDSAPLAFPFRMSSKLCHKFFFVWRNAPSYPLSQLIHLLTLGEQYDFYSRAIFFAVKEENLEYLEDVLAFGQEYPGKSIGSTAYYALPDVSAEFFSQVVARLKKEESYAPPPSTFMFIVKQLIQGGKLDYAAMFVDHLKNSWEERPMYAFFKGIVSQVRSSKKQEALVLMRAVGEFCLKRGKNIAPSLRLSKTRAKLLEIAEKGKELYYLTWVIESARLNDKPLSLVMELFLEKVHTRLQSLAEETPGRAKLLKTISDRLKLVIAI